MKFPATRSYLRANFFLVSVLALLWAQALGLAHRTAHMQTAYLEPRLLVHIHDDQQEQFHGHARFGGWIGHFESAPQDRSADCLLLDHLTQCETIPHSGKTLYLASWVDLKHTQSSPTFWEIFRSHYGARAPPSIL